MINYSFSRGFVLRWLATAALGRRRDAGRDGERELARYRATRGPDGKGGTTIAAEFTRPS